MVVISPCDREEARKATLAAAKTKTPVYIRLAREKTPVITAKKTPFEIGKGEIFWGEPEKSDVALVATGSLVYRALNVAKMLSEQGISATVVNISTIKPIDEVLLLRVAKSTRAIVTIEEHQIAGGLGSVVAEFLARTCPTPMEFVGIHDMFGQSGTPDELIAHYGMDERGIRKAIDRVLKRK